VSKESTRCSRWCFGQVDAAVVSWIVRGRQDIQPEAAATLKRLKETKPIVRPPFVAVSGVAADYQAKVVGAMKAMKQNPRRACDALAGSTRG